MFALISVVPQTASQIISKVSELESSISDMNSSLSGVTSGLTTLSKGVTLPGGYVSVPQFEMPTAFVYTEPEIELGDWQSMDACHFKIPGLTSIIDLMLKAVSSVVEGIIDQFKQIVDKILKTFQQILPLLNDIKNWIGDVITTAKTAVSNMYQKYFGKKKQAEEVVDDPNASDDDKKRAQKDLYFYENILKWLKPIWTDILKPALLTLKEAGAKLVETICDIRDFWTTEAPKLLEAAKSTWKDFECMSKAASEALA